MKTRSSTRRETAEPPDKPPKTSRRKEDTAGHMSNQPSGETNHPTTSSIRKRHSPNSGQARKDPSSGIAVVSAAPSKQRRLAQKPTEPVVESGESRELRYLTDFFPNKSGDERRLTRSQCKGSNPDSPLQLAKEETDEPAVVASNQGSSAPSTRRTAGKGKKGKKEDASSSNQEAKTGSCTSVQRSPDGTTSSSAGGNRVFPLHWQDALGDMGLGASQPGPSTSNIMSAPMFIPSRTMLNQISVIQHSAPPSAPSNPYVAASSLHFAPSMLLESMAQAQSAAVQGQNATGTTTARSGGARSAASAFIGNLVPRMQHLLGASGHRDNHTSNVRINTIMEGLRSANEIRQSEAASELADLLLMGNEDSLPPNLPIKELISSIVLLLQKEHNFELMLTAARCLTNMLEALPRAQPLVVEAVPYLLEKLKRIECIDVAEQSLTALEVMSRRNGKTIMASGGIAATISHIDFFSLSSQRLAFSIAANCALFVSHSDFHLVRDSLAELTQRLLIEDKRCLDSICLLFSRLVDNMRNSPDKLREIAGQNYRLMSNMQQLVLSQPSLLSSTTFPLVIKILRLMASKCSDLAVALIQMHFAGTLRQLFIGNPTDEMVEIVDRPPNQLTELVFLTGEMFPRLPTTGVFDIDAVVNQKTDTQPQQGVMWYWRDDDGWQPFRAYESRSIEMAKTAGEREVHMHIGMQVYHIDIAGLKQTNTGTGTTRELQRRTFPAVKKDEARANAPEEDRRLELLQSEPDKMEAIIRQLFPVLVEVDGSSSGPALRYESLRVMLRMVCPMSSSVLRSVLSDLPLSGHIASALASPRSKDLSIVVAALQLVHMLLEKLSDVYAPLFRKEGVAHEVAKLANMCPSGSKSAPASGVGSPALGEGTRGKRAVNSEETRTSTRAKRTATSHSTDSTPTSSGATAAKHRHRKRTSPEGSPTANKEKSRRKSSSSSFLSALRLPSFRGSPSSSSSPPQSTPPAPIPSTVHPPNSAPPTGLPFFYQHMMSMSGSPSASSSPSQTSTSGKLRPLSTVGSSSHQSPLTNQQKERIRVWIKKEAELLLKTYLAEPSSTGISSIDILADAASKFSTQGTDVGTEPLRLLYNILEMENVSAFELKHSGILTALHLYLTSDSPTFVPDRKTRLRRFATQFMHLTPTNLRPTALDGYFAVFEGLVQKVLISIAQLEQFQVKVTDMGGIATGGAGGGCLRGAQALRFFQSHQIRCNLRRHPSCRELVDWRHGHGSIKVDPLTSISAIERYLLERGIGYVRPGAIQDESSGEDELSDEDNEGILANPPSGSEERRIEIVIGDNIVPGHISVLQALRQFSPLLNDDTSASNVGQGLWMNTHTLFYRSAVPVSDQSACSTPQGISGPPAALPTQPAKDKKHKVSDRLWIEGEVDRVESPLWGYLVEQKMDGGSSSDVDDPSYPSILLLRALYGLNRHWWGLYDDDSILPTTFQPLISLSCFQSSKLSAKLSRQLSDFLTVATQQIPSWTVSVCRSAPFLFPFSLRRSLLYCTAFGRDRALMHLVNQTDGGGGAEGEGGRGLTPRLERKKISIKRDDILKSAEGALLGLQSHRAMLEVSFEGEAGTGFGPTLEFYSTVSKELQQAGLKLWHGPSEKVINEDGTQSALEYVTSGHGLYPTPAPYGSKGGNSNRIKKFELVGRLMAQSLVDARMLDLPLSPLFLSWLTGEQHRLSLPDIEVLDPGLYSSIRKMLLMDAEDFECLEQYFTLPGNENFEVMKGGRNKQVSKENAMQYAKLVCSWRLREGVMREMEAVRRGFGAIVDASHLSIFSPEELDQLFCGCPDNAGDRVWGEAALAQSIKPDHGYSHDSEQIKWLLKMLASFDRDMQRKFVQFVTGSPRLPVGGFRALNPALTVVRKSASYGNSDEELPSAMTCYNYLKVPAYSSYSVFCERFSVALRFVSSFHLT